MMMVNILLRSIFQSVFVIALPENEKTTCDEKEGQLQLIRQSPAAIGDEVYDKILNCLRANIILKCRHNMSSSEKKVYHFLKKGIFTFSCIYDPVYSRENDRIVTREKEATMIVPRKGEVDDIISFFYNAFKGEGARKLFPRIRRHYTVISIKRIQKWVNSNEDHFKTNPIFSNKPPLTPVISNSVQGCNQIDLVDMRSMAVSTNGTQYNYVLSVLDVFSRYLWLRPLSGKNSVEVLKNLKQIFR